MAPRGKFRDRETAGRALAPLVLQRTWFPSVVLGVPHGGVAVARPIAQHLKAPLSAAWVRKLAAPKEPDAVVGAVDIDGDVTLGVENARAEGLSSEEVCELAYHAHRRLLEDWRRGPGLDAAPLLPGADAIIVDDGLTTGLTLRAAMRWARRQHARRLILAVPVVDSLIWFHLAHDVAFALALETRTDGPVARSEVYEDFHRPSDEEVAQMLALAP